MLRAIGNSVQTCLTAICFVATAASAAPTPNSYAGTDAVSLKLSQDGNGFPGTAQADQSGGSTQSLFQAWKAQDRPGLPHASVPSRRPLDGFRFTSPFGVRSDPFRERAAMHTGADLAAPTGTPVYATADGVVSRAERAGGYGNLVQIEHGAGIETRYGHLSKILVHQGERVERGMLIALVGSTGRSTGSHLHYEVRIAGQAVNPLPYMDPSDAQLALNSQAGPATSNATGIGGPDDHTKLASR